MDAESLAELKNINGGIMTLVSSFLTNPLSEAPNWWKQGLKWDVQNQQLVPPSAIGTGDTRTSRSRAIGDTATSKLAQTMSRHSAINSQLTGKRTITSALRNYNLGSPSSDHLTGGAIDLVGQNLGQYASIVNKSGGFAEFHGSAGSRHLHAVPGAGIGDSSTPSGNTVNKAQQNLAAQLAGKGVKANAGSIVRGSTINYFNIEVNGGNQSPEQIANVVMAKLMAKAQSQQDRGGVGP